MCVGHDLQAVCVGTRGVLPKIVSLLQLQPLHRVVAQFSHCGCAKRLLVHHPALYARPVYTSVYHHQNICVALSATAGQLWDMSQLSCKKSAGRSVAVGRPTCKLPGLTGYLHLMKLAGCVGVCALTPVYCVWFCSER